MDALEGWYNSFSGSAEPSAASVEEEGGDGDAAAAKAVAGADAVDGGSAVRRCSED